MAKQTYGSFQPLAIERLHGHHVELAGELPVRGDVVRGVLDGPDAVNVLHGQALGIPGHEDRLPRVDRLEASDVVHEVLLRKEKEEKY